MPSCRSCGSETGEGAAFCPTCGQRLRGFTEEERQRYINDLQDSVRKEEEAGREKRRGEEQGRRQQGDTQSKTANVVSRVGKVMAIAGAIIALAAGVILCAGPLLSPSRPETPSTPDSTSETDSTSTPTDIAPSLSDIEIIQWHLDERYGTTYVVGELRNNSGVAVGVQLQAVVRDGHGQVIDSAQWWPASTNNIPAGGSWPINYGVSDKGNIGAVEVSVVRVKAW